MLTGLQIGNFKAFSVVQRIPIRPLTLIFGPNSSGKSSIIHGLVLARHADETGELDVHLTHVGGESVDLGGFGQYIHRRESTRRMEWSAECDSAGFTGRLAELFATTTKVGVSAQIGLPQVERMRIKVGFDGRTGESILVKTPTGELMPSGAPEVQLFEIKADSASILLMSKRRDGRFQIDRLNYEHPVFREVLRAIVITSTTAETIQPSDYEGLDEAINQLIPDFTVEMGNFLPAKLLLAGAPVALEASSLIAVGRGTRRENLASAVRLYFPRILDEMIQGVSRAVSGELARLQYLGPLRSYPPRHLAFAQQHDSNWNAGGGFAWDVVRKDENVRRLVNEWLSAREKLQTPYELTVREFVGVDDLEPTLLQELRRLEEEGVQIEGEPESEHTVGSVYPAIDIEVEMHKFRDAIKAADVERLDELVLVDQRTNTVVSHRDVGIGISQVLPVLVAAYGSSAKILAMEQPEIHLHPALQAELGDVFISSALGSQRNTFLLETHSEHLILRIMRRMRESASGELPKNYPPVRPEDVSILYVEPRGSTSIVRVLELDSQGDLLDPWPGGFFEEGFRERFS